MGVVSHNDIKEGSEWLTGPSYLKNDEETWPVTQDFLQRVPTEETRPQLLSLINVLSVTTPAQSLQNILYYSNSLDKVKGIMARVLKAARTNNKEAAKLPLTVSDLTKSEHMMLLLSQPEVTEILTPSTGNRAPYSSLAPFLQSGVWYTRGRLGKALGKILGPDKLPVLPTSSRLSYLYMVKSHRENHGAQGDTLFRSRAYAWIIKGRHLAAKVCKECQWCKGKMKNLLRQQMADLPPERTLTLSKPWTCTSLDLLGPYQVRAMNNSRSHLKTYPIVFCCMNTGALHTELAHTYGADAFLTSLASFTAIRGNPAFIYSDKGSQLTKASNYVTEQAPDNWDWAQIQQASARSGTRWKFCPAGCQYRNGLSEARVKAIKTTLSHLFTAGAASLTFAEFRSLLSRCANIVNDRPLGVRHHKGAEGQLVPITPNLLLLGKTSTGRLDNPNFDPDTPDNFTKREQFVEELLSLWWDMWFRQAFDSLFPLPKWKTVMPNLNVGDVCLIKYDQKVGKGDFRLCRVVETKSDDKGLVRTVSVVMRPKYSQDKSLPYVSKDLTKLRVGINRLVLICPAQDAPADPVANVEN